MPANMFHELSDQKKQKIISVGIAEFGKYGYTDSSTNRIVKDSGISKGSLFKYFEGKEDLYFYLLDCVTSELNASLGKMRGSLPDDLFGRVIQYSEMEFSWYIQNREKYRLIIKAFTRSDSDIYRKTEARYNHTALNIYDKLLADVHMSGFKWSRQKTLDILRWFLQGFNESFISKAEVQCGDGADLDALRDEYVKSLSDYIEILKQGLL